MNVIKESPGDLKKASEVILDEPGLLEKEFRIDILKKSIEEGCESGLALDFDAKMHLEQLKASKRNEHTICVQ